MNGGIFNINGICGTELGGVKKVSEIPREHSLFIKYRGTECNVIKGEINGIFAQIYDENGAAAGVLKIGREQQERILDKYQLYQLREILQ